MPDLVDASEGCGPSVGSTSYAIIDRLEGGTFVDVGASIGFVTVRAARRVAARMGVAGLGWLVLPLVLTLILAGSVAQAE